MSVEPRAVGHTRDAGWEVGVSAVLDIAPDALWGWLTGSGLAHWLGETGGPLPHDAGATGRTATGGRFEIRSVRDGEKIRLRWEPAGGAGMTVVQVSVRAASRGRARLGFHEERLPDARAREHRREHWRGVISAIAADIATVGRDRE
ncbi:SRPBCC domain-containing protein [Nakamurella deserti]|uniref:SRPBCC domain-containing protein n=1 Tax=Nakamurella deserti TaxID=2164074 RepID=UPI000DBE54BE|nr:SRPBCC domain-containing protein [Nakamurella deserti]